MCENGAPTAPARPVTPSMAAVLKSPRSPDGRDCIPWLSCYGQKTQQTEWVWEATVKVADLDEDLIKQLTAAAILNLNNA